MSVSRQSGMHDFFAREITREIRQTVHPYAALLLNRGDTEKNLFDYLRYRFTRLGILDSDQILLEPHVRPDSGLGLGMDVLSLWTRDAVGQKKLLPGELDFPRVGFIAPGMVGANQRPVCISTISGRRERITSLFDEPSWISTVSPDERVRGIPSALLLPNQQLKQHESIGTEHPDAFQMLLEVEGDVDERGGPGHLEQLAGAKFVRGLREEANQLVNRAVFIWEILEAA